MNKHPLGPAGSTPASRFKFPGSLPQYRVMLLQNAEQEMMFVVRTIMELTRFCRTEATYKMWQARYEGSSGLVVTHKERAELFVELFATRGLRTAIEPT